MVKTLQYLAGDLIVDLTSLLGVLRTTSGTTSFGGPQELVMGRVGWC